MRYVDMSSKVSRLRISDCVRSAVLWGIISGIEVWDAESESESSPPSSSLGI